MSGITTAISGAFSVSSPPPAGITFKNSLVYAPNGGSATTPTLDCTGADLIVIMVGTAHLFKETAPVTDSLSNVYTALTLQDLGSAALLYYKFNPSVSSSQTFTITVPTTLYACVTVLAFSGAGAGAFHSENGYAGSFSTQPGAVVPAVNGSLVVTGICCYNSGGTPSVNSGMTYYGQGVSSSIPMAGIGWLIQATAGSINPTWTSAGLSSDHAIVIADFHP